MVAVYALQTVLHSAGTQIVNWEAQKKESTQLINTLFSGSQLQIRVSVQDHDGGVTKRTVFKVSFDEVAVYALQLVLHSAGTQIDNWEAQKKREHAASRNLEMQWKLLHHIYMSFTQAVPP